MSPGLGPIVIGSSPSAGSTLLRTLLQRHSSIFGGPELHILDKPELLEESDRSFRSSFPRWLDIGYPSNFVVLDNRIFVRPESYGWTKPELLEVGAQCSSYMALVAMFYERCLRDSGARRWMEKSPGNVLSFSHVAAHLPDARMIHITRDPRDVILSLLRRGFSMFRAVSRWFFSTLVGVRHAGAPYFVQIRYEDLVARPEAELRRVCAFLGEDFEPAMLDAETEDAHDAQHIESWRHRASGAIADDGVRAYADDPNLPEIERYLASARLSWTGRVWVRRHTPARGPVRASELIEALGYEKLSSTGRLAPTCYLDAARDCRQFRYDRFRRFERHALCPTTLSLVG
jgi:hypothetical protein